MTSPFPKWARWIAQGEDGQIFIFEYKPLCLPLGWVDTMSEDPIFCIELGTPNPHWRESLDCLGEDDD